MNDSLLNALALIGSGFVGRPSSTSPLPAQASNATGRFAPVPAGSTPCERCHARPRYCNALCLSCFELMQDLRAGDWED